MTSSVVGASAAYLAVALAGWRTALRRAHPVDVPGLRGRPERMRRDAVFVGTALSPPLVLLAVQAAVTVRAASASGEAARRAVRPLRVIGVMIVAGHLCEAHVRRRLRRRGWDRVESTIAALGLALGCTMAAGGGRSR